MIRRLLLVSVYTVIYYNMSLHVDLCNISHVQTIYFFLINNILSYTLFPPCNASPTNSHRTHRPRSSLVWKHPRSQPHRTRQIPRRNDHIHGRPLQCRRQTEATPNGPLERRRRTNQGGQKQCRTIGQRTLRTYLWNEKSKEESEGRAVHGGTNVQDG